MYVCVFNVKPVLRSKHCVQFLMKFGFFVCLYIPVLPSVPEIKGMYGAGWRSFLSELVWRSGKVLGW